MSESNELRELVNLVQLNRQVSTNIGIHVLNYNEQLQMKMRERQFLVTASSPENYEANKPYLDLMLAKPIEEVIAEYDQKIEELQQKIQQQQATESGDR